MNSQPKYDTSFLRQNYHQVLIGLIVLTFLAAIAIGMLWYQALHRPLPAFAAVQADGKQMVLTPFDQPNLLPDTILQWTSKAATIAYTFDFVNYRDQISAARPYFTDAGWQDYLRSVSKLIDTIVKKQLFVNGVVSGTPVIANQGPLPERGYVWRVEIPFLVSYQTSEAVSKRNFVVVISLVHVPTSVNPQGIGIDQFVMV